ncbi:MAG: spore coat polysaccharide biosynthesis protein SpsC [Dehalococcoidia bacterium]|nr:spore coat polysaccharide biosynthesis protein SpsC [Dehalococcoidia bacterium]
MALLANDIRGEVIVPSMTWVATANVVLRTGGTPVFCEVDPASRNVTADLIADQISDKTEAVIIVHFAGMPCQMDEIVDLCQQKGLLLVEDSAETLGATWNGKQAGSFGVGCFSFFPTKNITTGEGGMFTCDDEILAQKARTLIGHGVSKTTFEREKVERPWIRAAKVAGHNYRMPNPLAALGYSQMVKLDAMNSRRQAIADVYNAALHGLSPHLKIPEVVSGATHVYQMYTLRVNSEIRDEFVRSLRASGIGASVHFDPPVHLQPCYLDLGMHEGMLPTTELLARELVTLPMYPGMSAEERDAVVSAVKGQIIKYNS